MISNLPDAEFKTLVIRVLNELTEYGNIIKKTQGEVKLTLLKQRKNDRESTVEGMKLRFKSTILNKRKKKIIQSE